MAPGPGGTGSPLVRSPVVREAVSALVRLVIPNPCGRGHPTPEGKASKQMKTQRRRPGDARPLRVPRPVARESSPPGDVGNAACAEQHEAGIANASVQTSVFPHVLVTETLRAGNTRMLHQLGGDVSVGPDFWQPARIGWPPAPSDGRAEWFDG